MINIYIKKLEEKDTIEMYTSYPKWIKKTIMLFHTKFNKIIVKEINENNKIYLIPNVNKKTIYKKIRNKIEKEKTKTQKVQAILEDKVKKYKDELYNIKIVDGKDAMLEQIENILNYILGNNPIELQDIYILTNSYDESSVSIIKKLAVKAKTMNIITKNIEKYRTLEKILEEKGIALNIANNKKKSLKKAKIIINLNLSKDEINTYQLFRNSIVINLSKEKLVNLKGFEGTIIDNIDISLENNETNDILEKNNIINNFKKVEIYQTLTETEKRNVKIKVNKLYGNNGELNQKEKSAKKLNRKICQSFLKMS